MAAANGTSSLGKRARETSASASLEPVAQHGQEALADEIVSSDDDDDVGPMPMPAGDEAHGDDAGDGPMPAKASATAAGANKKRKILKHEKVYLNNLPSADRYYRSFMHRDVLTAVAVTKTDFILTASVDGHLKFWKKRDPDAADQADTLGGVGIEFVKHYRAHLAPILALAVSTDGALAATISADGTTADAEGSVKVFDVENFDMINILSLPYKPSAACWVHQRTQARCLLAVAEEGSHVIRIYDGRGDGKPVITAESVHRKGSQVTIIAYNEPHDTIVSADDKGMLEYWTPREPFELPETPGMWKYKSDTDLYEFRKTKALPNSLTFSPSGSHFVTTSLLSDRHVRIFSFLTGKLYRKYDETLTAIQELQQAGTAAASSDSQSSLSMKLDQMEFGRRLAVERELSERSPDAAKRECAIWDETGNFILYPSLIGIKVINTVSNKLVRVLGKDENHRFLNISLYQGAPLKKGLQTIAMAASDNPLLNKSTVKDPTLFCTAFKRSRFYLFSQIGPDGDAKAERDVFNEKPTREEAAIATVSTSNASKQSKVARNATIHTTMGDIHFELLPDVAPKAVENFVGHARSSYYEGVIFHRIIKKFMLQTGDPLGDGTGGESIWNSSFEDEIDKNVKHDRPYTLSMANAGPKTNGSQFFITTVPCPWLDGKHTIFGRATSGYEVIHTIENVRVDKTDKPFDDIKIVSITIH